MGDSYERGATWLDKAADERLSKAEQRSQKKSHSIPLNNSATAQHPPHSGPAKQPKLAFSQDIFAEFRVAVQLRGLVGEIATAQLLYLVITSRLLDKPISAGVKGHSSSGKSHTLDRVVEFFPDDAVVKFTAMSSKALVYRDDDYKHRTIIIYEVTGLREGNEEDLASYFVRTLLSEGRIDYDVTVRGEEGKFTTQRITKEGPTNLVFTTTKTHVHAENETRILSLNTDDSTAQTRNVLLALADESERSVDFVEWRQLQVWLQTAERRVTIPYARQIAEAVPPLAVRLRRDFSAVLALIRAHAILHQATRERDDTGRIIATIADYAAVRKLVIDVISEGIGATVSDRVRETVRAVDALGSGEGATVTAIAKYLEIDKSNASRRVRQAAGSGYIRNMEDKRGRPARWVAGDPLPEAVEVLPQPATLSISETHATSSCCAVALLYEGVYSGTATDDCRDPSPANAPIPSEITPQQRNTTRSTAVDDDDREIF